MITITAGRPNREGEERDFAGPDGTYPVTLIIFSDRGGAAERSSWFVAPPDGLRPPSATHTSTTTSRSGRAAWRVK